MDSTPPNLVHFPVHSGLGLESVRLFAQDGMDVLLVDVNLHAAGEALALI